MSDNKEKKNFESYPDIPAVSDTGYFGPLTKQSVAAFQRQFGPLRERLLYA